MPITVLQFIQCNEFLSFSLFFYDVQQFYIRLTVQTVIILPCAEMQAGLALSGGYISAFSYSFPCRDRYWSQDTKEGAYYICRQQWLGSACETARSNQSLFCSCTTYMDPEDSVVTE